MHMGHVPPALRDQLADPATVDLLDLLDRSQKECMDHVMSVVGDRFERRLVDEASKLRVEMSQGFGDIRHEMADGFAAVRQELAALRQDMADHRFDILKWVFLFWVGQFLAVASLMVVMARYVRP